MCALEVEAKRLQGKLSITSERVWSMKPSGYKESCLLLVKEYGVSTS
jgi:hypothetical protein